MQLSGVQVLAREAEARQWCDRKRQLLVVLNLKGTHPGVSQQIARDRLLVAHRCCKQVR